MKEKDGITSGGAIAYIASTDKDPSKEQREARKKEISERKKTTACWNYGETSHWTREYTKEIKDKKPDNKSKDSLIVQKSYRAYMASLASAARDDFWYTESGCSKHMTKSREVFNSYCDISSQRKPVEGIGGKIVYV
jgi:hypothetical protein